MFIIILWCDKFPSVCDIHNKYSNKVFDLLMFTENSILQHQTVHGWLILITCILYLYIFSFKVEVKFRMGQPVKVTGNLIETSTTKDYSNLLFTQTQGDVVSYIIQLPNPGYYKLQVYALPVNDDSKTLPGVYNYLINCTRAPKPVQPFPKQYAQWKEGCYLYGPLTIANADGTVNFKAVVPKGKQVAVTVNDTWTQLKNSGGDVWEGAVQIVKNSRVTLNVNYGGDETKYSTLLEYNM